MGDRKKDIEMENPLITLFEVKLTIAKAAKSLSLNVTCIDSTERLGSSIWG